MNDLQRTPITAPILRSLKLRSRYLSVVLCTSALALAGCLEDSNTDPDPDKEGTSNANTPETKNTGGEGGGATAESTNGGMAGRSEGTGGTAGRSEGTGGGEVGGQATGGSDGGGQTAGGESSMGGAIQGGAAGTPGAAGAAGAPATGENLCVTKAGGEYLFDYTYGLMGEFAFEMSMSCDIGGYLLPLMPVPGDLTEVTVFVGVLADWFHAAILECPGATTELGTEFVMVPVSENRVMSSVDFETIIDTFAMVVSRHTEYDDGFTEEVSEGVFERLNAYFDSAVTDEGSELTHAIDPETGLCMPPF